MFQTKNKIEKFLDKNKNLYFKDEVLELYKIAFLNNKINVFQTMVFYGKSVFQISNLLKKHTNETVEKITNEFHLQIKNTKENLLTLTEIANESTQSIFNKKFLEHTQDAFSSFLKLCSDFTQIKNWEIDKYESL